MRHDKPNFTDVAKIGVRTMTRLYARIEALESAGDAVSVAEKAFRNPVEEPVAK